MVHDILMVVWAAGLGFVPAFLVSVLILVATNFAIGGGLQFSPPVVDQGIYLFTWFFVSRSIYWRFLHRPRKLDRPEPPQDPQ